MMLVNVRDDLFEKMLEISGRVERSIGDYVSEVFEQAVRADGLTSSLKEAVDHYERLILKEAAEEAQHVEEPSIPDVFERMLASKVRPSLKNTRCLRSFSPISPGRVRCVPPKRYLKVN